MCILCVEWEKNKMTSQEVYKAIGEMINTSKDKAQAAHLQELSDKIMEKELPLTEADEELHRTYQSLISGDDYE